MAARQSPPIGPYDMMDMEDDVYLACRLSRVLNLALIANLEIGQGPTDLEAAAFVADLVAAASARVAAAFEVARDRDSFRHGMSSAARDRRASP